MSRRARYADDNYNDDNADDDPRAPRSNEMRSRRPPTQPPTDDDAPSRPEPHRKPILIDPNADPKDRRQRRSRSTSRVRVKPPPSTYHSSDDECTIKGNYVRHRNGEVEFVPEGDRPHREAKRRTHDLEKKDSDQDKRFRQRRDGYESDEGESLRKSRPRGPKDSRDSIGDVEDHETRIEKPKGRSAWDSQYVKPRRGSPRDEGAFVVPDRTHRDRHGDELAMGKRRDVARRRHGYDDEDDVDLASRRRPERQDARHERGYESEGPSRRRSAWGNDDRVHSKRGSARYDDDYLPRRDLRDDRRLGPVTSRYNDSHDRRDRPRRDETSVRRARSDARGRDRDRYGARDDRDPRRDGKGKNPWAEQAGTLFMTHAMPVIKREGSKWARKELESFMAQRR